VQPVVVPDGCLEGTRLTLVNVPNQPDAVEFSIRCGCSSEGGGTAVSVWGTIHRPLRGKEITHSIVKLTVGWG
jgi:hypothetical protein